MSRWQMSPFVAFAVFVAYLTRASWMGCVGLPYTVDIWLHQTKHLQCEDMTLFYERTDKLVATCGSRRDGAIVRNGEWFTVCGRRFHAAIERSYPEERFRLSIDLTPDR